MTVSVTTVINGLSSLLGRLTALPTKIGTQVSSIVILGLLKGYSWENIKRLIQQFNCESGNGLDYKFLDHNNGWGMMVPSWSPYATGSVGIEGQAVYPNVFAATLDRFTWDKRNGIRGTEIDYMSKVQQAGYNGSSTYPQTVAMYQSYRNQAFLVALATPALLIGIIYLISKF